jgi:hypothetical protein
MATKAIFGPNCDSLLVTDLENMPLIEVRIDPKILVSDDHMSTSYTKVIPDIID